jgi:hypothetical protein
MTDKPDLATESGMTPEGIAANGYFSCREKLDRLKDMKRDLGAKAEDYYLGLTDVEKRMAAVNIAIARVKRQDAGEDGGAALGRMTCA